MSKPILIEEHWNCGVCGCSHKFRTDASACCEGSFALDEDSYDLPQQDALVNIITNEFDEYTSIDVPRLARRIRKYIRKTHYKKS